MNRIDIVQVALGIRSYRLSTLMIGIALLATSISCTAKAQTLGSSNACKDGNFVGLAHCLNFQVSMSKAQLSSQYNAKLSELKDKEHDHLLLSQETWMAYVQAQCDVAGDRMGMSVQWTAIPVLQCTLYMINDRIRFLMK